MRTHIRAVLALVILLGMGSSALAQEAPSGLGFGLRAGMGLDPDQFVVGAQFSLGKSLKIFRVVPSVDAGFGNSLTTIDFNADFLARLLVENTSFGFYGGGGPTLAFIDRSGGNGSWEFGISLVAGLQVPIIPKKATNIEARFGILDIPDFRLLLAIIL
jgi:hypothetical protein